MLFFTCCYFNQFSYFVCYPRPSAHQYKIFTRYYNITYRTTNSHLRINKSLKKCCVAGLKKRKKYTIGEFLFSLFFTGSHQSLIVLHFHGGIRIEIMTRELGGDYYIDHLLDVGWLTISINKLFIFIKKKHYAIKNHILRLTTKIIYL